MLLCRGHLRRWVYWGPLSYIINGKMEGTSISEGGDVDILFSPRKEVMYIDYIENVSSQIDNIKNELEKFCIRSFEAITKTFKFFRKLKKNKIEKLLFLHNRKDRKLNIENQTLYVRLF